MPLPDPVIVVPGITATYLHDEYTLPPTTVWSVLTKKYERVSLHPDDMRWEAREPARVHHGQVFEIAYEELIEELRYNLTLDEDEPVPVYPFGYDWRQPLDQIEAELAAFVDEVAARTKLMRHYHDDGYGRPRGQRGARAAKVNLVGHSMGGLVIAGYLERAGRSAPVGKVATLASPFRGSYEAVIKVITGTANLGTSPPSSREREAARLTPALYHLIPDFDETVDLFDPAVWQRGVIQTLTTFIEKYGLPRKSKAARTAAAEELFAAMLDTARAHRERIRSLSLQDAGLKKDDWLVVAGAGTTTRARIGWKRAGNHGRFVLSSGDRMDHWEDGGTAEVRRLTGDGTVPFEGAMPPFLDEARVVCVTPDDYGYWELQDRVVSAAAGFHGILPNMNMLHRLLVRFFLDGRDQHKNTWGRRVPGVASWDPPLELQEKGSG